MRFSTVEDELGTTQSLLDLRVHLLDRAVVRAVRRQRQYLRPRTLDRRGHPDAQVGLDVVEDHHVACVQLRHQHLIHVRLERRRVGRSREGQRGTHSLRPQRRDQGGRLPRSGCRVHGPCTARRPGVSRRHRRGDPRLVHEDQPLRLDLPDLASERTSVLLHLGAVPLVGVQALLLVGQAPTPHGLPQRLQAAGEAAPPLQFVQGGVGLLSDQFVEPPMVVLVQGRRRSTAMRPGLQRAGLAASLEPSGDGGGIDAEDAGDLADRALMVIDRREDPLAEVRRVGPHNQPPFSVGT